MGYEIGIYADRLTTNQKASYSKQTWSTAARSGRFTIEAKAKDTKGAESEWAELEIIMPKNKLIKTPFLRFLENHPHLYPLIRQILGL